MDLLQDGDSQHYSRDQDTPAQRSVSTMLLAPDNERSELPDLPELTTAATTLARGLRRKALLTLADSPAEFALVREGDAVLVSSYDTSSAPEIHQLNHRVPLDGLLQACARATLERARLETDPTSRQIATRLAERALRTQIAPDPTADQRPVRRRGGHVEAPRRKTAIGFGFDVEIYPSPGSSNRGARADVHALLFEGELWAFVHGRRLCLAKGPVMLAVQRMVVAARVLLDAWTSGRTAGVRLRAGEFFISVRLDGKENASITLRSTEGERSAAELEVPDVVLPILRVASDSLRALLAVDRTQTRNLRVSTLRDEVRALRRIVREHTRHDGFVNEDPDRIRLSAPAPEEPPPPAPLVGASPLGARFEERWRICLDGLEATSVFFCGDRLVLSTGQHSLAVDRNDGHVIWAREGASSTFMAGATLVRVSPDGDVELCDVTDGEAYALARIVPRVGGPSCAIAVGGGRLPPMVVIAEGANRLVAIDIRTGEPQWRFSSRQSGAFHLRRAGRLLLVACDGAVHGIDVATGEDAWRFAQRARFAQAPVLCGDLAVAVSSGGRPHAFGLDLYSGELRWKARLPGALSGKPISTSHRVVFPLERDKLLALDSRSGAQEWTAADPGLGLGGATLTVDDMLLTNAPGGCVTATDLRQGANLWCRLLGDPLTDEVPRRLEPVLRGGGLFVPAANVHLVRPSDGEVLSELPCELVPDRLRVDERGWVYVAEESGYVAAYAPAPQLRLIRGGG